MQLLSGDGAHKGGHPSFNVETFAGNRVVGWFPREARETLSRLIEDYGVGSVIEVGSYLGLSACWFAERGLTVVCVDTFNYGVSESAGELSESNLDQYRLFLRNTAPYPNISHFKMDSLTAAGLLVNADLVYIDAGHEYEDVKADVEAWTPHARKVVCGDDNTFDWPGVQQYASEIGANVEERVWWFLS